jgi:hypothetical protein
MLASKLAWLDGGAVASLAVRNFERCPQDDRGCGLPEGLSGNDAAILHQTELIQADCHGRR